MRRNCNFEEEAPRHRDQEIKCDDSMQDSADAEAQAGRIRDQRAAGGPDAVISGFAGEEHASESGRQVLGAAQTAVAEEEEREEGEGLGDEREGEEVINVEALVAEAISRVAKAASLLHDPARFQANVTLETGSSSTPKESGCAGRMAGFRDSRRGAG